MASSLVVENPSPLRSAARVAMAIRGFLGQGRLQHDQTLVPVSAICEELKVSSKTVQVALQQLENEGLIEGKLVQGRLRAWVVRSSPQPAQSLMGRTVVLLTFLNKQVAPNLRGGHLQVIDSAVAGSLLGANLHLFSCSFGLLTEQDVQRLLADPPMGIAVSAPVADMSWHRDLIKPLMGRVPMVVPSDEPFWAKTDRVIHDHVAGAAMLTHWLLDRGVKKILRLWRKNRLELYWLRARNRGYLQAMKKAGLAALPSLVIGSAPDSKESNWSSRSYVNERVDEIAAALSKHIAAHGPVEAIMAASDDDALQIAGACRKIGLVPNENILIVGYDNYYDVSPLRAYESAVPAATIDKNNHLVGQEMVRLLKERVAGQLPAEAQCVVLPPSLVVPAAVGAQPATLSVRDRNAFHQRSNHA